MVYVPVKLPSKLLQYSYDMDHYHSHLQYDDYFPAADGMISHMGTAPLYETIHQAACDL